MPTIEPFDAHTDQYDAWFETHEHSYASELSALQQLVPDAAVTGLSIGVGTGRFAQPLGIQYGIDPSREMLARAAERGITPLRGVAERLPVRTGSVDLALLVTTICFVDDVDQTLASARRILQSDGLLVVGLIDADSPLGHRYRKHQDESPFYRHATLHSTEEIRDRLEAAGFSELEYRQTLFDDPAALDRPDRIREGFGDGGFVGIAARP